MPTVLTHPAVPLAIAAALGQKVIDPRLLTVGIVASIVPDLDVIAFLLGIAYSDIAGHRGITHSLAFAVGLGLVAIAASRFLRSSRSVAFWFVTICTASHGLLDMFTNGGLGIALLWPITDERYFFPARVIEVSPLSIRRIFSEAGLRVLGSELLWVWLPAIMVAVIAYARRKSDRPGR